MEKYYCEPCRLLYNEIEYCKICGALANKKIKIEVHSQSEKNKGL
jgi:rRNA maturation endonuclease Nob1